jgi:hypothetical protein
VVLVVVLAILALYLGLASRTAANQEIYQLAAGLCAGAALALVLIRILRR